VIKQNEIKEEFSMSVYSLFLLFFVVFVVLQSSVFVMMFVVLLFHPNNINEHNN